MNLRLLAVLVVIALAFAGLVAVQVAGSRWDGMEWPGGYEEPTIIERNL